MAFRKKRVFLTNSEKFKVLQEIKSGVAGREIENKYNICARFRQKILQQESEITAKAYDLKFKNKKIGQSSHYPKLESALLKWFIQKRDSGQPISSAMIQEKALMYNEMLKESPTFKVCKLLNMIAFRKNIYYS